MPVLTGIDILGIQRYVFASNRLRDALAASWVVDHVTKRAPNSLLQWGMTNERVMLCAGGNAIVEFDTKDEARTWTRQYTRWLQEEAPGLEAVVAHRPYDGRSLAWALKALSVNLARAKLERQPSAPQLGLSVTAACSVTGMPANTVYQDELVSRSVRALREKIEEAKKRWQRFLPQQLDHAPGWNADFPDEIDLMGRTHGETSLLGLVRVDGNGVGQAIKSWLDRCLGNGVGDEQVRAQYGEWSRKLDELSDAVLHAVTERVASCIFEEVTEHGKESCVLRGTPDELEFRLHDWSENAARETSRAALLPIRPILLGGDDFTFVCDGRIALDLAGTALREFKKHAVPHLGENGAETTLTACAGVALVKAHAPFHRGYELAEGLCRSAKEGRVRANETASGVETGCWLDWHVGSTRPGESVEEIRERQYKRGRLTMRPYPLVQLDDRKQSWSWLDREVLGPASGSNNSFRGLRERRDETGEMRFVPNHWSGSRSRVKRLGSLVSRDPGDVQRQVSAWKAIEQDVELPAQLPDEGFIGRQTPLLDAIELLDLHLRLEPDPRSAALSAAATTTEETTR